LTKFTSTGGADKSLLLDVIQFFVAVQVRLALGSGIAVRKSMPKHTVCDEASGALKALNLAAKPVHRWNLYYQSAGMVRIMMSELL
jgi:hypothetical protein